jgi:demethylmenaquinone methyltransferase/2-methoxy-6-polyprenyl-1,4-benzoquinol methylase
VNGSEPLRPHADLTHHYASEQARPAYVRGLFDEAAPHYEWINRLMSFGSGAWYRRRALESAGLLPGDRVLDIASGTGLVARAAASVVGPSGRVLGLDPSRGMLREQRAEPNLRLLQGLGEKLPLASDSFDFVSLGYGLRHIADLNLLFVECVRVLRPGGRLLVLEFGRPRSRVGAFFGRVYLKGLVPAMARLATRSRGAEQVMRYCWDTVDQAVAPEAVVAAIGRAGLTALPTGTVAGVFIEYRGQKPRRA